MALEASNILLDENATGSEHHGFSSQLWNNMLLKVLETEFIEDKFHSVRVSILSLLQNANNSTYIALAPELRARYRWLNQNAL